MDKMYILIIECDACISTARYINNLMVVALDTGMFFVSKFIS
jgi:hypothetical protein